MGVRPTAGFRQLVEDVRSGLWFVPAVCVATAVALAAALIEVDQRVDQRVLDALPRVFGAGPDGSRSMLAAIATAMVTVAGVVFSITIVALSLASSQYTSRVLRTFLRDRANQVVLGIMVGVFAYCLVVLRTIRGGGGDGFVPLIAVQGAVVLAFVGIGALIFYIHHIATAIQATHILAAIRAEADQAVDSLFPEGVGEASDDPAVDRHADRVRAMAWRPVVAHRTGYVQRVDADALLALAREHDLVVRMEAGIGDFVHEGTPIASVSGAAELDPEAVNACFSVGPHRTTEQDPGFPVRQMVDMAMKALSPGVNDTTTAVMCVDYLTAVLVRLAGRRVEPPYREAAGELRLVARGPTFESLLAQAFNQVRQNAGGNVAVLGRLLRAVDTLAAFTRSAGRRWALLEQAEAVLEVIGRTVPAAGDREPLEAEGGRVVGLLRAAEASSPVGS